MDDQSQIDSFASLARRLEKNRDFMAYVLAAYRSQEGLSEAELAADFGVLPALIVRLALCRRPASGTVDFAQNVRRIADATLVDESKLANILNQVEALEKLSELPGTDQGSFDALDGLLAAARDRVNRNGCGGAADKDEDDKG